jgi:hypothetical protein
MIPEETIKNCRLVGIGCYGLASGLLWGGSSGGDELSGAGIAVGVGAALGLVFALISYVRAWARGHRVETIRSYFRDVQIAFTDCTLGVLSIFCALLLTPRFLRDGYASAAPAWYLPIIVAISVHQFVRAARRVKAKWRTVDDVLQRMRGAAAAAQRFSATYDIGFFVGISIVTSILGRYFGSGQVLLVGGVLCALSFPFALGSMIYQRVVLARLLPDDMPLPDWYDAMSRPQIFGNVSARVRTRTVSTRPRTVWSPRRFSVRAAHGQHAHGSVCACGHLHGTDILVRIAVLCLMLPLFFTASTPRRSCSALR